MHDRFVTAVEQCVTPDATPVVHFESGQDKDAIATAHRTRFAAREGIVMLGIAQEKMRAFKAHKQTGPGVKVRFEFSRQWVAVNQYYFYVHDRDWGKDAPVRWRAVSCRRAGCKRPGRSPERFFRVGQRRPDLSNREQRERRCADGVVRSAGHTIPSRSCVAVASKTTCRPRGSSYVKSRPFETPAAIVQDPSSVCR